MKIEIFKNWRTALAIIFLAIFINWQVISAATTESDSDYSRSQYGNVYEAIVAYHKDINDIFNEYIEVVVSSEDPNTAYDEDCPSDNVSTYCLAKEVIPIYIAYLDALDEHSEYPLDESAESEITNLSTITQVTSTRLAMISAERESAYQIIDLALAAYNEFQIMYPIHTEYEHLIKDFEDYNEILGKWRTEIAEWPGDFIDVSTTDCK